VAASFGLTFGQLTLLPFSLIHHMESKVREERNAPFVANFILNKSNQRQNESWIKNMPAETLAKLLTVLVHYHDIPEEYEFWFQGSRDDLAENNVTQGRAILTIFEWLGADKIQPSNSQFNRFENAVQRMGLNEPTQLDDGKKWELYAKNVLKIKQFFDLCVKNKYGYQTELRKGYTPYDRQNLESHKNFVSSIKLLTRSAKLYLQVSTRKHRGYKMNLPEYLVSKNNFSIEAQGYKEINWNKING